MRATAMTIQTKNVTPALLRDWQRVKRNEKLRVQLIDTIFGSNESVCNVPSTYQPAARGNHNGGPS
jgi:hypothetical protein